MKKVLVVVFVLTMGSAFAQKGEWYIGTSAMTNPNSTFVTGFLMDKGKTVDWESTIMHFGVAPEAGYFLSDKFSVGLGVAFKYTSSSTKWDLRKDNVNTVAYGFNPYVRYFLVSKGNFGFYLQGGLSYVSTKDDREGSKAFYRYYIGINPGISYGLGEHFGLTASFGNLGYNSSGENDHHFTLNIDMSSLRLGLRYSF